MYEFLDKILNKERKEYNKLTKESSRVLFDEINTIKEKEIRKFFEIVVDASERVLRALLFKMESIDLRKELNQKKFNWWLKKVFLVMIAYSYYCTVLVKKWYRSEDIYYGGISYEEWFNKVFEYYNQIFDETISKKDIDYYAAGYKEDAETGYSVVGDEERVNKTCEKDCLTIGSELLKEIWQGEDKNRSLIIGGRIWEAHKQLIRPYLEKIANE